MSNILEVIYFPRLLRVALPHCDLVLHFPKASVQTLSPLVHLLALAAIFDLKATVALEILLKIPIPCRVPRVCRIRWKFLRRDRFIRTGSDVNLVLDTFGSPSDLACSVLKRRRIAAFLAKRASFPRWRHRRQVRNTVRCGHKELREQTPARINSMRDGMGADPATTPRMNK